MASLVDKCRTVASYHGNAYLALHAQHADEVVRVQRAALLEAADRIEELEAEAARLRGVVNTLEGAGRVAGVDPCLQEQSHVRDQDSSPQP